MYCYNLFIIIIYRPFSMLRTGWTFFPNQISVQRTCRQLPTCLTMQMKPISGESSRTLNTYCSCTCLTVFQSVAISGNGPIASSYFPRLYISLVSFVFQLSVAQQFKREERLQAYLKPVIGLIRLHTFDEINKKYLTCLFSSR